ncbi:MAG: GxxExxY protein [Planctomycetes bacterium]|nr:GxxExxY protein [Planctomycetota bacterium]
MDRFDDEIEKLAADVIGAAIEVHRHLGPGHAEAFYAKAMEIELGLRGIPFEREHRFEVGYKDRKLGEGRIDFWVGKRLSTELKAVKGIDDSHIQQVVFYLSNKKEPLGLVINFNVGLLKNGIRRVVQTKHD